jgi:hypothetical protein
MTKFCLFEIDVFSGNFTLTLAYIRVGNSPAETSLEERQ